MYNYTYRVSNARVYGVASFVGILLSLVACHQDPHPVTVNGTASNASKENEPSFVWSEEIDGASFSHAITAAYAEIIHWKRNQFHAPSGKAGISFVNTLASLFRAYGECSSMESIAIRAAIGSANFAATETSCPI